MRKMVEKTDPEEKKTFKERYKACKLIEDEAEQAKCLFPLLYEITKLQDHIQLAIPDINNSIRLSMGLVNNANAIILGVARNKGNLKKILDEGYVMEKVDYAVKSYNNMIHDLNLTKEEEFEEKLECESVPERTRPAPSETREYHKKELFKDQEKVRNKKSE